MTNSTPNSPRLRVVSLFSGIAGGDLGLERAGHTVLEMCESWDPARRVLAHHFPKINVAPDVRAYTPELEFDLLSAGFPCVDLSHAGSQSGIFGPQSGLVEHVFRIAERSRPEWILIENVPNLLRLQKGAGIRYVITELERLGYRWAYRIVDSRAFGVAQRRNRVIVLASLDGDPAAVLLGEDAPSAPKTMAPTDAVAKASGFYWTEGRRGVGLVADAIPTLKGGSTVGAPSAPAVWMPNAPIGRRIVLPSLEDAEALQGFPRGWTSPADLSDEKGKRWKLVGNAITVGLAAWLGGRLSERGNLPPFPLGGPERDPSRPWPEAAFGGEGRVWPVIVSRLPRPISGAPLDRVIDGAKAVPLSHRATRGFLSRVEESGLVLSGRFMADLESHLAAMRSSADESDFQQSWAKSPNVKGFSFSVGSMSGTPEIRLRRELSALGLRYHLQSRPVTDLRWRSDIVFEQSRVAVEVRSCFWHGCPIHDTWPTASTERWVAKLAKLKQRNRNAEHDLKARGWKLVVVWEHDDPTLAASAIQEVLYSRPAMLPPVFVAEASFA